MLAEDLSGALAGVSPGVYGSRDFEAISQIVYDGAGIVLPPDELRRQVVKDQWEEVRQYSVGPMTQLHVLVEFDRKIKDRILEEHQRMVVAGRVWRAGVGLIALLAFLAVFYGYLRIDLATGGAYRARLRLAVAAAILGVVAAAVAAV